jgi:hypothetical protein
VTGDGAARAPAALFAPDGEGLVSAGLARGPWDAEMMHGGAPSALLARAVQAARPGADLVVTRLTIDFLRAVPLGHVDVATTVVRPGRRFQVVDATLDAAGRRACIARAVRVRRADLPEAAASPPPDWVPLPAPERGEPLPMFVERQRELFYPDAVEIRHVAGEIGSGAVTAWIRLRGEVVPGEEPSPLERLAAAVDFADGLSWILPFRRWLFVNTELTIHLRREPEVSGSASMREPRRPPRGTGCRRRRCTTCTGRVGVCAQSLFVEPR